MGRLGRENVENASPNRILAHHLNGFATLIADALQMLRKIFERDFLADPKAERQLPVKARLFGAEQSGCNRNDRYGNALRGKPPQTHSALFGDLVMWREALLRQHVKSGD